MHVILLLIYNNAYAGIQSNYYNQWLDAIETKSHETRDNLAKNAIESLKNLDDSITLEARTYAKSPTKPNFNDYQTAMAHALESSAIMANINSIKAFTTVEQGFEIKHEIDSVISKAGLPDAIKDIFGGIKEFKKSLTSLLDVVLISDNDITKKAMLSQNPLETFKLLKTVITDDKQSKFIDSVIKAYTNIKDIQGLDKILEGTIQMTSINMQINDEQRRFNEIKTLLSEGNVKGAIEKIIAYNLIYPSNGESLTQEELENAEHLIDSRELRLLFHKKQIEDEVKAELYFDSLPKPDPKNSNNTGTSGDVAGANGNNAHDNDPNNPVRNVISQNNKFQLDGSMSLISDRGNFVYGKAESLRTFDRNSQNLKFINIPRESETNNLILKLDNNNKYLTTILANERYNNNLPSIASNDSAETIRASLETKEGAYEYSYLAWGEWNGMTNLKFTDSSNGQQSNIMHGRYIVGVPTAEQLPKEGSATYAGNIHGDFTGFDGSRDNKIGGTITLDANFANSTISGNMNITHDGNNFATTSFTNLGIERPSGSFHGNMTVNNGSGGLNGTFYGNEGQEIGGAFSATNNLGNASGIYNAHK